MNSKILISSRYSNRQRPLPALGAVLLCLLLGATATADQKPAPAATLRLGMVWNEATEQAFTAGGARPFECSYAYSRAHVTDLDVALEPHLKAGVMSESLREALTKGLTRFFDPPIQLSEDTTIEIAGKGSVWLVRDSDSRMSFYVEKAKDFATRKKDVLRVYFDSPYWSISHWTLSNGISVSLRTDRLLEEDSPRVTSLAVANSTLLFACKGESWYPVQEIQLDEDGCRLVCPPAQRPPNADAEELGVPVYLWKGMTEDAAVQALNTLELKALPTNASWKKRFPSEGRWSRYSLPGTMELAVNLDSQLDQASPTVRWIIIEATGPAGEENEPTRYRIECETLDLQNPLGDDWHWAFDDAWSWDPNDPDRMQRLRETGQRRWTKDQWPQ